MPNDDSYRELATEYVLLCFVVPRANMSETFKENKNIEGEASIQAHFEFVIPGYSEYCTAKKITHETHMVQVKLHHVLSL